jgi:hypothetical protein
MSHLGGPNDSSRFHPVHAVNNFNFSFNNYAARQFKLFGKGLWTSEATGVKEAPDNERFRRATALRSSAKWSCTPKRTCPLFKSTHGLCFVKWYQTSTRIGQLHFKHGRVDVQLQAAQGQARRLTKYFFHLAEAQAIGNRVQDDVRCMHKSYDVG